MTQNFEPSKTELFNRINELGFAVLEAVLFLDTHPNDSEALSFYNQCCSELNDAIAAYEAKYGPLTVGNGSNGQSWDWINAPWPWQNSAARTETSERTARIRQV